MPVWAPGAHVTVHLPNGLPRCYSLCGDPADRSRYRIAVHRAASSRGGSAWLHANAAPGTILDVSGPDNHFILEPAEEYLFVAGGIGITPIKAMIEALPAHRRWRLVYIGRSRATMAFSGELQQRWPQHVSVYARDETGVRPDLARILNDTTAAVYCCGPASMTEELAALVPAPRLHIERFSPAAQQPYPPRRPFEVTCTAAAPTCTSQSTSRCSMRSNAPTCPCTRHAAKESAVHAKSASSPAIPSTWTPLRAKGTRTGRTLSIRASPAPIPLP